MKERWFGSRRWLVLALSSSVPVGIGASSYLSERLAGEAAVALSDVAHSVMGAGRRPRVDAHLPEPTVTTLTTLDQDAARSPAGTDAPRTMDGTLPRAKGLLVSRERVMAAVRAGHRPSGTAVSATDWRPAGMALVGVSGTGAGLLDGDVLTRVGGSPARSEGVVIGAVAALLDRGAPAITGEVWRGRQRIVVTVELPRLVKPRPKRKETR